jgi:hypothetical protein
MSVRSRSSRVVLWAAMCALLLKAAVPLLASAAAAALDKSVAEVCTVYGVALPDPRAQHHARHHHVHDGHAAPGGHDDGSHVLAHQGDHCALSALAALATSTAPHASLPPPAGSVAPRAIAHATARAPDTSAL